jgi:hypothetical protein
MTWDHTNHEVPPHKEVEGVDERMIPLPAEPAADVKATLALIAAARRSLAEARTLPDIRRVMEAASVAEDAGRRAAKLAEAQRMAADGVEAANQAANDAAAVRMEAQARAGELLREMAERGDRKRAGETYQAGTSLADLGVTRNESSRWQRVAEVPEQVRQEYVEETKAAGGEVSTADLLRREAAAARPSPARRSIDHVAIGAEARKNALKVYRELLSLAGFRPESLVSALDDRQKKHLLRTLDQLSAWLEDVRRELAVYRVTREDG